MSNKDDNNIFLKYLEGVKPLKKNNKVIKPIPKTIKSDSPRTTTKEIESDKIYEKVKNITVQQKTAFQKNDINKKLIYMIALEMLNSLWYVQTPKRVEKLVNSLLEYKNVKSKR